MQIFDKFIAFKLLNIFIISFLLNFIWEHLHSVFYTHYQGGPVTETILLKATFGDALFITALSIVFFRVEIFKRNTWMILPMGIIGAILLELFALSTGRWAYNEFMPILPYLGVGLTPTVQLGVIGYISIKILNQREMKTPPNKSWWR